MVGPKAHSRPAVVGKGSGSGIRTGHHPRVSADESRGSDNQEPRVRAGRVRASPQRSSHHAVFGEVWHAHTIVHR